MKHSRALLAMGETLRRVQRALRLKRHAARAPAAASEGGRKGFDAADLGQGRKSGGGPLHQRNRRELMLRVANAFPASAGEEASARERDWRLWGALMCKRHGPAIGHVVRDLMNKVLDAGAAGGTDVFRRFTRGVAREVLKPEIVA